MIAKNHILAEIRRTTAQNGGTPLGRLRFQKETGIREHEWTRFWARWSEAVRDAGFAVTNQFTVAIPNETLFEHLAMLTRELGRFPVIRDLQVKSLRDPNFPSPKTYRRIGNMASVAEQLKAFAEGRGYTDVVALCPAFATPSVEPTSVGRSKLVEIGSVYLMKSGRFFKIGHSNAVGRREREIAIQLPEKLKVVHEIRTDDPSGIEDYWHRRFEARRRNGEWFDLTADDVAAFRRRKTM